MKKQNKSIDLRQSEECIWEQINALSKQPKRPWYKRIFTWF